MAKGSVSTKRGRRSALLPPRRVMLRWVLRGIGFGALALVLWIWLFAIINPPRGVYMRQEANRLGDIEQVWVDWDDIAPVMARSIVAAEDANYCLHWGFDMAEIRRALDQGGTRGASTLSQQVVKNVFLWHGRDWTRKAAEAALTPIVETLWSKRRILEVYMNVAEFDEGVFGVEAAARHYFGTSAKALTPTQAARLAMVLPNPKERSASRPTGAQRSRSARILDGAQTIAVDGRAACFQASSG